MSLTINKAAADILTTDCAHVWRGQDVCLNGLGTWLADSIKLEHPDLAEGLQTIELAGGINLRLIREKKSITILDADYIPLNGVKDVKLSSFGKTGVSYFVNSHEGQGRPTRYSLTKVLYPSKTKDSMTISKEDAELTIGATNERGMAMCEFLLKSRHRS